MKFFKVCIPCVPPKRHPGCHETCSEYQKEKEEYEKYKAKIKEGKQKENESYSTAYAHRWEMAERAKKRR